MLSRPACRPTMSGRFLAIRLTPPTKTGINRNPQPAAAGTNTATPLGPIGVFLNGVPLFNPKDAMSYNNQNIWHQNAAVVEASSFDTALGHPAPQQGATGNPLPGDYHHHQLSPSLDAQLGGDSPS